MSVNREFYMARAAESARDAENATLDNVRERCRRSEAAWLSMADRLTRGEAMREKLATEKAARREGAAE
ncbi:hypothetical protein CLG96_05500 [Sphingomonas oleivorans]|uniref:Uncharacterized protein n=1 Tax=Sphingomonas oleivorans TaxID=1735121 RepID=A0A2T5G0E6_9SPHN|nr:hypothetical protein [Sphingomonas oleivorans]PTQ12387.1 hypothetical protein CLG96_05500 [Sphingomonas oleivorans]